MLIDKNVLNVLINADALVFLDWLRDLSRSFDFASSFQTEVGCLKLRLVHCSEGDHCFLVRWMSVYDFFLSSSFQFRLLGANSACSWSIVWLMTASLVSSREDGYKWWILELKFAVLFFAVIHTVAFLFRQIFYEAALIVTYEDKLFNATVWCPSRISNDLTLKAELFLVNVNLEKPAYDVYVRLENSFWNRKPLYGIFLLQRQQFLLAFFPNLTFTFYNIEETITKKNDYSIRAVQIGASKKIMGKILYKSTK